ncbi:MAG: Omp28-related outer membrane protein [Bacteroidales bacterium]|nr:Omp28-related outer membrane protein [Bacteroidales bacterium]
MKKAITFLTLLLFLGGKLFSQGAPQYVSTNPSLKNMVIEEFTGRNCHACPSGHKTANRLLRENPGRLFLINIYHALEPDTYPNLKTEDSETITKTFGIPFVPSGIVNRNMDVDGISTNWWEGEIYTRSKEIADCNIGGYVVVDEETRKATINVEIYYTSDSNFDDNYLSIAMTQDSIWGSQIDGHENPEQYVDGNYCHMHVLRDIVTSTWGDKISPTTAGTLISKTYTYDIPEIIGSPNGVDVDLENINFLAFVTDTCNSYGSYTMENVALMPCLVGTQEAVYPHIDKITERKESFCASSSIFSLNMMNRGLDELTSIKMLMEIDNGDTFEYEWNGSIASYEEGKIEFEMDVPIGNYNINFKIIEANGVAFSSSKTYTSSSEDVSIMSLKDDKDEITIEIMQDRNGHETTWQLIDDNDNIVASGGPYEYYFGQSSVTELHTITVGVDAGQCLKFVINDLVGNGICCNVGEGYYRIIDGYGNIVVDGDGDFGYEASHNLYTSEGNNVNEIKPEDTFNIYPNPAKETLTIEGPSIKQITIYSTTGQIVKKINCDDELVNINVGNLQAGIYFVNIIDDKDMLTSKKISIVK